MKKMFALVLTVSMITGIFPAFLPMASADTEGYYTYEVYDGEANITNVDNSISGDIIIPPTLGGYPVTAIDNMAFNNCRNLTSIEIPITVTSIGSNAFSHCSGLTSIEIPNSVTSIGNSVFFECASLTTAKLPNGITSIGSSMFSACVSLTSVNIPDSVTFIGNDAFNRCARLTSIEMPDGVISIGAAFSACVGLTSIIIPRNVTFISGPAFENCTSLASVIFEGDAPSVGGMDGILNARGSLCFYEGATTFPSSLYGKRILTLKRDGYYDYAASTIVRVNEAISGNIEIPSQLGGTAITGIAAGAFNNCKDLTSVTIPAGVTSVAARAFDGCLDLTEINVDSDNAIYTSVDGVLFDKSKTQLIRYPQGKAGDYTVTGSSIGDSAFRGCTRLTSVEIPSNVININAFAFSHCTALTTVTMPSKLTLLPNDTFFGCSSLTSVIIPNGITTIEPYTFAHCYSLTSVIIPDSVTSIGDSAFSNCHSLTSVTIPDNVSWCGFYFFTGCRKLTSITFEGNAPYIFIPAIGGTAFLATPDDLTVYYYDGATDFTSVWHGKTTVMINSLPPMKIISVTPIENTAEVKIKSPVYGTVLVTAVYDGDKLLSIMTGRITPEKITDDKMILENLIIPLTENTTIKAMIWDGTDTLQPLCNYKEVRHNGSTWE